MVGRSKPKMKNSEPSSSTNFSAAENMYLKAKNLELAKALTESKAGYAALLSEKNYLSKELLFATSHIKKLENYIKTIETATRAGIDGIVSASSFMTEILQTTNLMMRRIDLSDSVNCSNLNSLNASNRTRAVKPMINGHVICNPTISLTRVNEVDLGQIYRLRDDTQSLSENNSNVTNVNDNEGENLVDNVTSSFHGDRDMDMSDDTILHRSDISDSYNSNEHSSNTFENENIVDNRLNTILEESEVNLNSNMSLPLNTSNNSMSLPSRNSHLPLLSGVFRDVRVYLSPIPSVPQHSQHISTERGSGKSRSLKQITRSNSGQSFKHFENVSRRNTADEPKSTSTITNPSASSTISSPLCSESLFEDSSLTITGRTPESSPSWRNNCREWINVGNHSDQCSTKNKMETTQDKTESPAAPEFNASRTSFPISSSATLNSNYDPLEGPSHLLDSFTPEQEKEMESLELLTLKPKKSLKDDSFEPVASSSPSCAVTKKKSRQLRNLTTITKDQEMTPKKQKKTFAVTKRKLIEKKKKKPAALATKVAKVLVTKLSPTELTELSSKKYSNGSINSSNKSEKRFENASVTTASDASLDSKTPKETGRPTRGTRQAISFKEPSLRKKLRRSK